MANPETSTKVGIHGLGPMWYPEFQFVVNLRHLVASDTQVHPILAQALSKVDFKAAITPLLGIDLETEGIGVSERERVSCEVRWARMRTGESIFGDSTIIDIECD